MKPELNTHAGIVKPGMRIRIIHLNNGTSPIDDSAYDGKEGKVLLIDDNGRIHGDWGGLSVYNEDDFEIISE